MELLTLDKFPRKVLSAIDVQRAFIVSRLIVAAESLQLFRKLHGRRMNAPAIGRTLKIHKFYRDTLLNSLVSLGLLHKSGSTYWNTPFAERYFIGERSIYWTRQYSKECVQAYKALTMLEQALGTGRSYAALKGLKTSSYTEAMEKDRRRAEDFTQMLFHFHLEDARALANCLDLSAHRALLDVGGGSGVMSIALVRKNPYLRACVLDIAAVCEIAARNISRAGLSKRIRARAGDFRSSLPDGYDAVMFCDIGPVSRQLLRNAYKSLPEGGLVVLVDRYLSDDRTRPLDRIVSQFIGSSFPQATRSEMVDAVRSCGFQQVRARKMHKDVWLISGRKRGSGNYRVRAIRE